MGSQGRSQLGPQAWNPMLGIGLENRSGVRTCLRRVSPQMAGDRVSPAPTHGKGEADPWLSLWLRVGPEYEGQLKLWGPSGICSPLLG